MPPSRAFASTALRGEGIATFPSPFAMAQAITVSLQQQRRFFRTAMRRNWTRKAQKKPIWRTPMLKGQGEIGYDHRRAIAGRPARQPRTADQKQYPFLSEQESGSPSRHSRATRPFYILERGPGLRRRTIAR